MAKLGLRPIGVAEAVFGEINFLRQQQGRVKVDIHPLVQGRQADPPDHPQPDAAKARWSVQSAPHPCEIHPFYLCP